MKITKEYLDKADAEHEQLIQPKELDKEMRRLARLGLELEKCKDDIVKVQHEEAKRGDEYHRGMYNGMECILACCYGREPWYVPGLLVEQDGG